MILISDKMKESKNVTLNFYASDSTVLHLCDPKLFVSFMERVLAETLPETRTGLLQSVLFSHRFICKILPVQ